MGRRKLVLVLVVIVWACMELCADERESFLLDYMNKAIWVDRKDKSNYDFDVSALFFDYNNDGQEEAFVAFHGDRYTDGWLWTMLHRGPNGVQDDAPPYSEVLKEECVCVFSFPYSFMCATFRGGLRCILGRQMRINKYMPDGTKMGKEMVRHADAVLTMDSKGHPQVHDLPHEIDDIVGNPGFEKLERAFWENYQGREMKREPWNGTWRGFKPIPAERLRPLGGIAQPPEFDDAFVKRYREEVKARLNVTNDVTVLAVFHDADNDGDVDAYVSSSAERTGSDHYRWHLYLNNGKGAFVRATRRFWKRTHQFDDAVYVEPEVVASRTAFHRLVRFGRLPALIVLEKVGNRLHTHGFLKYLTEEERRNQPHVGSALYDKEKARAYHEWGDGVNDRLAHVRPFDLRELVDDFSFFRLERLPCREFSAHGPDELSILSTMYVFGDVLPLRENVDERFLERGREMMTLKNVPVASATQICGDWVWPAMITVRGVEYKVVHNSRRRDFKVILATNETSVIAKGDITRLVDSKTARECAFGENAMTSMLLEDYAGIVNVRMIDTITNALYLTHGEWRQNKRDCLAYKNLFLRISGSTNNFDLAVSLLNAGLPESERLSPLPLRP